MNINNEILDAIEIIIDKKMKDYATKIYSGICAEYDGVSSTCNMKINGKVNKVKFYGNSPVVGQEYRVFIPDGNMSFAFIICPGKIE